MRDSPGAAISGLRTISGEVNCGLMHLMAHGVASSRLRQQVERQLVSVSPLSLSEPAFDFHVSPPTHSGVCIR